MRITMNDGVGLAVEVAGDGPGLLLVHGLGGAKEDFADHVPALARENRVVIFDHRGHGASDKPTDPAAYSLERLVADSLAVADATGLDHFRLLGHSMGGMVARKIAIQESSRVDALVMMDTSAGPIPGFDPDLMQIAVDTALTQGKQALKDLIDWASALETPAYKRVAAEKPGFAEFEGAQVGRHVGDHVGNDGARARPPVRRPSRTARRRCVRRCSSSSAPRTQPFLIASELMKEAIPGAQLVVIPDAGHSPQFENPDAWIAALTGFLSALPATAR